MKRKLEKKKGGGGADKTASVREQKIKVGLLLPHQKRY